MRFLDSAVTHYRSTLAIMLLLLVAGILALRNMPVETQPTIYVPYISVQVRLDGISPEDGARLLIRPLEQELRALDKLDEVVATARESVVYLLVKFEAGEIDVHKALNEVRTAVDRARAELPVDAEEPLVEEISATDFPAVTVTLRSAAGARVSERQLYQTAQLLRRQYENLPQVLEANLAGHREEVVEALIDPARLTHYNITSAELATAVLNNNLLVPAGQLDAGNGRFAVKVPGLIEDPRDVTALPVRSTPAGVITLGDVADIRRTFKDPERYTSVNGQRALVIEVEKRAGGNQIELSRAVRALQQGLSEQLPPGIEVSYVLDMAEYSQQMVGEMAGNIVSSVALVLVVVIAALGLRSGLLVGAGVPFSILTSLILLDYLGFSFNFMVMFGMLLALGMLVDGAIVITEFADRKMAEGLSSRAAYQIAVKRMFWPVNASTATTLAAFLPIMFWPGVSGDFMRYLPVTVFAVLASSLLYALLFAPVIGALMGPAHMDPAVAGYLRQLETESPLTLPGFTGAYARLLYTILRRPVVALLVTVLGMLAIFMLYGKYNAGTEFFVEGEEKNGYVTVRAQGNLSVDEARDLVNEVERLVLSVPGVHSTYSSSGAAAAPNGIRGGEKDQIGTILVELEDIEDLGRSSRAVFAEVRALVAGIPGIIASSEAFDSGPPAGKPVHIQLESRDHDQLLTAAYRLRHSLETEFSGLRDITDTTPLPGIEWELKVDRARAAQLGVNVIEVGRAVQLVTNGVLVGEFRPDDADDEVEIRVRYPEQFRGINAIDLVRVNTPDGPVPISSFVSREARPRVDKIERIDGIEVITIKADVEDGVLADAKIREIQRWLEQNPLEPGVSLVFRGANEEQEKAAAFLGVAFLLAMFLMFILLITQFNSFYQALLIMSAVIMSTGGVLLGLLLTQSTFSVILTGVGLVALAGIVVNNNIVLIDTYNFIRRTQRHLPPAMAAVTACAQRLRPVFLTTVTTVLGLLPIALNASVDLVGRQISVGGVIASSYVPLASAIVYGLIFSTILTLIITPVMLAVPRRLQLLQRIYVQPLLRRFRQ